MANRRMFSKVITNSDLFLDMPMSSQLLYFHLGMNADDDGFVQLRSVMRTLGSTEDDARVLFAKAMLLKFEDGVVVIRDWLIHNEIRRDRYKPSFYSEQKNLLTVLPNRRYDLVVPNDNHLATQVRLGKDNKYRSSKTPNTPPNDDQQRPLFEEFWKLYPRKVGKAKAMSTYFNLMRGEKDPALSKKIIQGLERSLKVWATEKREKQYVPHATTWLNQRRWEDEDETVTSSFRQIQ